MANISLIAMVLTMNGIFMVYICRHVDERLKDFLGMLAIRDDVRYHSLLNTAEQLEQALVIQNGRIEEVERRFETTIDEVRRYMQDPPGISC